MGYGDVCAGYRGVVASDCGWSRTLEMRAWSTVVVVGELSLAVLSGAGVGFDRCARCFLGWEASVDELLRWRGCLGGCEELWSVADGLPLSITKRGLCRFINEN